MYSYSVALFLSDRNCPVAATVRVARPLKNAELLLGEVCRVLGVPRARVRTIELLAPTSPGAVLLGYDSGNLASDARPSMFLHDTIHA